MGMGDSVVNIDSGFFSLAYLVYDPPLQEVPYIIGEDIYEPGKVIGVRLRATSHLKNDSNAHITNARTVNIILRWLVVRNTKNHCLLP
jgi:hypothetical protein